MRPISTSCCQDHMGANWARVHTWDGKPSGSFSSDWLQADEQVIKPHGQGNGRRQVRGREEADPHAPAADCQS